jgi:hypothetical protein
VIVEVAPFPPFPGEELVALFPTADAPPPPAA